MQKYTLKVIGLGFAAATLGVGCFALAIKRNDPVFALLGFATLLPIQAVTRELIALARADQL